MTNVLTNVQNTTQLLVDTINLNANKLTQVPASALKLYPNVKSLSIAFNQITAINDLNLPANFFLVDLSNNSISSIASGAFTSKINTLFFKSIFIAIS